MFKEDPLKTKRQNEAIEKWRLSTGRGTLHLASRFGKTFVGISVCKAMLEKNIHCKIKIVVPSEYIQIHWNQYIEFYLYMFQNKDIEILTINTVTIRKPNEYCDLLIVDEIHKFTTNERMELIKGQLFMYKHILGLTGSFPKTDEGREIEKYAPIVDSVSEEEAIKNNWISPFVEYNLLLSLPYEDQLKYAKLTNFIKETLSLFKNSHRLFPESNGIPLFRDDYDVIMSCINGKKGYQNNRSFFIRPSIIRNQLASFKGWSVGLDLNNDYNRMVEDNWNPINIEETCVRFNGVVQARNKLLINNRVKLNKVIEIFNKFDNQIICFNESTDFADDIVKNINSIKDVAICYHSNIEKKAIKDSKGFDITTKKGELKLFGKTSIKKLAIEGMKTGRYKFLCTAKALDEGLDLPTVDLIITTGGTTNPLQYSQRKARGLTINAFNPNKITKIINLVFDNFNINGEELKSRDLTKLRLRQENSRDIVWITSLTEISNK